MGAAKTALPIAGVWLALEPVDMRCGMWSDCNVWCSTRWGGAAYVFRSARDHRLKILVWDATAIHPSQEIATHIGNRPKNSKASVTKDRGFTLAQHQLHR
jgi:IS66 Orf2 like protein